ncbi:preprotein translocase subunit SecG [Tautonia marina]|uniref:preprotein translocase subunit SecG n=1 Tax=Tautonia marina TaxID=2653855 RepID=UPI001F33D4EC|nr:preprotein translocase subunit SecG [Tautonia marina]
MEILPYVISSLIALVVCTFLGYLLPQWLTYILIGLVSALMIGLVLIQRGRGGGLAGAFGGVGGSSAFGTRAGDVFTRITIVTASVWIALNMGLVVNANVSRTTQQQPGGQFLPEGVLDTTTDSTPVPDFDADADADTDPLGLDLGTSDLPPTPGAADSEPATPTPTPAPAPTPAPESN